MNELKTGSDQQESEEQLLGLLGAQATVRVRYLDRENLRALDDASPLQRRNSVRDLCLVGAVLHHQELQVLHTHTHTCIRLFSYRFSLEDCTSAILRKTFVERGPTLSFYILLLQSKSKYFTTPIQIQ